MKLIGVLRGLILMLIGFLAPIVILLAVILAITLFFGISGYVVTLETWDQFMPARDTVLKSVFYHYLGYCGVGVYYWILICFLSAFNANTLIYYKNVLKLGLILLVILLIVRFISMCA